MPQAISTNTFTAATWIVSADPTQGTHTTIQAAINSAVSGHTILIRGGTYTENLTLKAGVNLAAMQGSDRIPTVTIVGNATFTGVGTTTLSSVRLQTNGSFCLSVTGSNLSIVSLISCFINATNNTAITYTCTDPNSRLTLNRCQIDVANSGIAMYSMTSAGRLEFRYCNTLNTGGSTTASASSAGIVSCLYTNILNPISTSGTGVFNNQYSSIDTSAQNATCLTSTGNGISTASFSNFSSGTASAVNVGGTSQQNITNANISSSNANALTGSGGGSLLYSQLRFTGTSAGINVPNILANTAVNIIGTTINISAGTIPTTLNIGTGAAAKTVILGSTTTTSSTVIKSGSGNVVINSGLTVDSTGRMTNSVQPAFGAYNTVDVANVTGDGTFYTCVFDTEVFDYGGNFASNTFTAPKTGIYQFSTTMGVGTLGALFTIGISQLVTSDATFTSTYANYSTTVGAGAANGILMLCGSWMARMDAADTATLRIGVFNGAKTVSYYGGAINSYFSGALVC